MKICLVSSCGGHLAEIRILQRAYGRYEHFYVLDDRIILPKDMEGRTWFVTHAERSWRLIFNMWQAWRILRSQRPSLMLSTGAGVAVPFGLLCKLIGVPIVFIESGARVRRPSLSGMLMYRIADRFFYQWPDLRPFYPRGTHGGPFL